MIVDSNNDATGLVVDSLTGTTGGPELPPAEFKLWMAKRNGVNRYFAELGYKGINTNQKAFAEGPYGRERQSRGPNFENNNRLTTQRDGTPATKYCEPARGNERPLRRDAGIDASGLYRPFGKTQTTKRMGSLVNPYHPAPDTTRKPGGPLRPATTLPISNCPTDQDISP